MLIIFGTKVVKTPAKNGLILRRHCDRCHYLSDLQEHVKRQYFTLFFFAVIPVSKGESVLICSRCGASFYPQAEDYLAAEKPGADRRAGDTKTDSVAEGKTIITCAYCNGRLRLPIIVGKKLAVTCPHCKEQFDVKLDST